MNKGYFLLAALAGFTAYCSHTPQPAKARLCLALDGDTLSCNGGALHLRLNGIDAPELPGHCRPGRACASGNPFASRGSLQRALAASGGEVRYRSLKRDAYNRLVAEVSAAGVDLSCLQLYSGEARYVRKWDEKQVAYLTCGEAIGARQ